MVSRIQSYKIFESHLNKRKEIRSILYSKGMFDKAKINDDLTVDYNGDINCGIVFRQTDQTIKIPFRFNYIDGNFSCINCRLHDLSDSPKYIRGFFNCSYNELTHLNDLPLCGKLICNNNKITYINTEVYKKLYIGTATRIELTLVDNPIYTFIMYLVRRLNINKSTSYLNGLEVIERLDEFEVIKNINEIDMISLNNLFDFYNIPFDKVQTHLMTTESINKNYKLI